MLCGLLHSESRDGRFWSLCLGEERCKERNSWEANLTCKANLTPPSGTTTRLGLGNSHSKERPECCLDMSM